MELNRWMERNEKKSSEIFHKLYVFQKKKALAFLKIYIFRLQPNLRRVSYVIKL